MSACPLVGSSAITSSARARNSIDRWYTSRRWKLNIADLSATGSAGCVARASRCKVNDGVNVNVAVDVKGWVKVIVDDKVNSCYASRLAACCKTFEVIAASKATQVTLASPRTRNCSTPWWLRRCAFVSSHKLARAVRAQRRG